MFIPHIFDKTFLLKNNTYYLKGMSQQILKLLTVVLANRNTKLCFMMTRNRKLDSHIMIIGV